MSARSGERGAALVVTLIFAAAMAAAAVAFLETRRSDALALRAQVQAVEAEALLRAALLETAALLANRTNRQQIPPQLQFDFGAAQVTVRIVPESAKVDLNAAEEPLLQALPVALGLGSDEAKVVAQTILDWRDENSERRTAGAESRDYDLGRQGASGAANRPLASTAELRYLPPVDPALWARLEPLVTIYSGVPTPNQLKAAPPVRRAMAIARGLSGQKDRTSSDTTGTDGVTRDGGSSSGLGRSTGTGGSSYGSGTTGGLGGPSSGLGAGGSGFGNRNGLGGSSGLGSAGTGGLGSGSGGPGGAGGLGTTDAGGTASGLGGATPGTSLGSAGATAETEGQARGNTSEDSGGAQSLALVVRFPNGYEAAAKAVIGLRPSTGGGTNANAAPFLVLDWAPVLRPQGAPS